MTATVTPPIWATNTNYAAGPDIGTPTKVDPASASNGFIKGVVAAPQHVNFLFNQITQYLVDLDAETDAAKRFSDRSLQIHCLALRELDATFTDTAESMAASMVDGVSDPANGVLCIKADVSDAVLAYDDPSVDVQGSIASITATVRAAATNGTRIVAVGTGGNANSYSDNAGGTWSAGAAGVATANPAHLVYAPVNALANGGNMFLTGASDNGSVSRSPNSATVWVSSASGFAGVLGLAVLGGATANKGYIVVMGASGIEPRFAVATDGDGTSFSGTQQPPNANTAEEPGSIAGAPAVSGVGDAVYHVMRCNAGARLRTALAVDGFTWTAGETIEAPAGASFDGAPRLMICQSTGLMVIAVPLDTGVTALYASLDFTDWVGPTLVRDIVVGAFAVAGGRLFMTRDAALYASDGIGNL
jgi:hypothetical protein